MSTPVHRARGARDWSRALRRQRAAVAARWRGRLHRPRATRIRPRHRETTRTALTWRRRLLLPSNTHDRRVVVRPSRDIAHQRRQYLIKRTILLRDCGAYALHTHVDRLTTPFEQAVGERDERGAVTDVTRDGCV